MEKHTLHFVVEGEFITKLAREVLFYEHDLRKAVDILMSATMTDQLTESEHITLCFEILVGRKSIVGRSDDDSYGIETVDETIDIMAITDIFSDYCKQMEEKEKELTEMYRKFSFVCNQLADWKLKDIDREYKYEYGEHLFEFKESPTEAIMRKYIGAGTGLEDNSNPILEDYLTQVQESNNEHEYADYGWLEPNGTYHEVEWGLHSTWAMEYCKEHYPFSEYAHMYWREINGERHHIVNGDFLIYALHWVLIDSPHQGQGRPTYDTAHGLTKDQKEFLYDYYIERNRNKEANALYEDD